MLAAAIYIITCVRVYRMVSKANSVFWRNTRDTHLMGVRSRIRLPADRSCRTLRADTIAERTVDLGPYYFYCATNLDSIIALTSRRLDDPRTSTILTNRGSLNSLTAFN